MKEIFSAILGFTFLIVIAVVVLIGVLMLISKGVPAKFADNEGKVITGSISEKCFTIVNGNRQGMFISGMDSTKPVLLFIHGGPGMPEYAISRQYPLVLEKHFTVCWWEHRGAGISFADNIPVETMNFDQFTDDAIAVTRYLRKRFGCDKIYLMAHSGGTVTGILTVLKAPELFHAYLSVSQITDQKRSEQLAYKYMVKQFRLRGDKKMLKKFAQYPIEEINTPAYYIMRDTPMHKLGIGTTHEMQSVVSGVFIPVMLCRDYTFVEKVNVWRGKHFASTTCNLWSAVVDRNLFEEVKEVKIPVYFFSGAYDYTTSATLVKEFYDSIKAPHKAYYLFENSAHSPMFEEPERMGRILREDVLKENILRKNPCIINVSIE